MNDVSFFWIAFVAYLVGMFVLVVAASRRGGERLGRCGRALVWVGLAAQTASIVWRAFLLGTEPLHQFLPRLDRSFASGPGWQAAVYVLLALVAAGAVALGVACRRRRWVWLVGVGVAIVVELILLDFLDFVRLPIEKVYEYLSLASWCSALALLAVSPKVKLVAVDAALALAACLLVVFAAIQPKTIELQLVPALQSYWLFIHVSLTSVGFAVFGMAFVIAAMFLVRTCRPGAAKLRSKLGAGVALAIAGGVVLVVLAAAVLLGWVLPFKEIAYAPHELQQQTPPGVGATQIVRYGATLLGAFAFWTYLLFWAIYGVTTLVAARVGGERDDSGLGHYAFVATTLAFFAAGLLVAGLVRRREQAIARLGDRHAIVRPRDETTRPRFVLTDLLDSRDDTLTRAELDEHVAACRRRSAEARRILSQARWLPLTDERQAELGGDPLLAALVALYREAGEPWQPPIRYKDVKAIGRSLGKQADLTEAVAARLAFPADRQAIGQASNALVADYQALQATALLPRTPVGQLAGFVGLAALLSLPLALVVWWAGGRVRERLPAAERLDGISYAAIAIAYPVFTFGALFAGLVWAHFAWGSWWGWDPKEVGSLVAWFLYTLYLHQRYRERLSPRTAAVFGMLGFVFASLSIAGNAFLGGLHAYS